MAKKIRRVLVTGGSSGIGKAIVERLSSEDFEIVFTYNKSRDAADSLIHSLGNTNIKAVYWDASDINSLKKLIKTVPETDILINNAGLGSATVKKTSDDTFLQDEMLLKVNAVAPLWLTKSYLPYFKSNGGIIINISSVGGGITQFPGFSFADGMSKAALTFFTKQLAAEMAHDPVHVYAICPGATDTPMFGASSLDKLSDIEKNKRISNLPGGRLINPAEIAEIVFILTKPEAIVLRGSVLDASLGLGVNPGLLQK
jgi:NAD(P)-dependent dehydrogenase (short-subunit alcohol dehydrogenase family)